MGRSLQFAGHPVDERRVVAFDRLAHRLDCRFNPRHARRVETMTVLVERLLHLIRQRVGPVPCVNHIAPGLVLRCVTLGIGWGLSGFCPGPALVNIASLGTGALVFAGMMFMGMALFGAYRRRK